LTSVVADNMTKTKHKPNKELVGQGIGNSIAAVFGGIPGAGATIRTVVNITSGGKTKLSGMIAGVMLLIMLVLSTFWNLVYAVGIGLVIASLMFMKKIGDLTAERSDVKALKEEEAWEDEGDFPVNLKEEVFIKHLKGPLFFGSTCLLAC